ncbi:MAG: NAD-dependent protein deacylase [Candidatus Omnitrophica bacterium]|nr:NAD-dependent protein deacylase [Candidatus Omnitrophota bacterium]MDD5488010.1 NAD-dependent protein deacylase [Candidatus Omnitrophota bacterium]
MEVTDKSVFPKIARMLKGCTGLFCVTGAGVSADSGLPTYRGEGGLYSDKMTEEGIPIEVALAGDMLKENPAITWKYLSQIEARSRKASFNEAHRVLAEMEKFFEVCILTQNIDGFHTDAGSGNVIEIHGNIHDIFCTECGWKDTVKDFSSLVIPPLCPKCAGIVRPAVVFFGETLPYRALQKLYYETDRPYDVFMSIGTTSVFPYIKEPIIRARNMKKATIEINPDCTDVSDIVDIRVSMGASEALTGIWRAFNEL